jgi:lauroyl/myristoyl acyltransferase
VANYFGWADRGLVLSATVMGAAWPKPIAEAPRFADRLEAWGAPSLFGGFKLLPLDCASALGGALARRTGPFPGVSKHARRNISRAFPELSETEIARIAAGMWTISAVSRPNTRIY